MHGGAAALLVGAAKKGIGILGTFRPYICCLRSFWDLETDLFCFSLSF